jgi:hypothetical protein
MDVEFRRTGERRYAVTIYREDEVPMEMNPAPGYDARMPHDLLHFIVESELGLRQGIFGQLAAGGTAGTFHPLISDETDQRTATRLRRHTNKRGNKLARTGRQDAVDSEAATIACLHEWTAHATGRPVPAGGLLTEIQLTRVCARMDELSARWQRLAVGESLKVRWPSS